MEQPLLTNLSHVPLELLQAMYESIPTLIRIDLYNYVFALDWLQTETNEDIKAYLILQLERIEEKYGVQLDRKKAAQ